VHFTSGRVVGWKFFYCDVTGELTWPVVRDAVDDVITVSEDEIRAALRLVWERMKCVIEPSAAVGVAVALSDQFRNKWGGGTEGGCDLRHVGVVLCGGTTTSDLHCFGSISG
jgi:threonine dehydratase